MTYVNRSSLPRAVVNTPMVETRGLTGSPNPPATRAFVPPRTSVATPRRRGTESYFDRGYATKLAIAFAKLDSVEDPSWDEVKRRVYAYAEGILSKSNPRDRTKVLLTILESREERGLGPTQLIEQLKAYEEAAQEDGGNFKDVAEIRRRQMEDLKRPNLERRGGYVYELKKALLKIDGLRDPSWDEVKKRAHEYADNLSGIKDKIRRRDCTHALAAILKSRTDSGFSPGQLIEQLDAYHEAAQSGKSFKISELRNRQLRE